LPSPNIFVGSTVVLRFQKIDDALYEKLMNPNAPLGLDELPDVFWVDLDELKAEDRSLHLILKSNRLPVTKEPDYPLCVLVEDLASVQRVDTDQFGSVLFLEKSRIREKGILNLRKIFAPVENVPDPERSPAGEPETTWELDNQGYLVRGAHDADPGYTVNVDPSAYTRLFHYLDPDQE
jgi:hypothetical protein